MILLQIIVDLRYDKRYLPRRPWIFEYWRKFATGWHFAKMKYLVLIYDIGTFFYRDKFLCVHTIGLKISIFSNRRPSSGLSSNLYYIVYKSGLTWLWINNITVIKSSRIFSQWIIKVICLQSWYGNFRI